MPLRLERLQGLDAFGKLRSGLLQAIPREGRILHFATRKLHIVAGEQRVQRPCTRRLGLSFGGTGGGFNFSKEDADVSLNLRKIRQRKWKY